MSWTWHCLTLWSRQQRDCKKADTVKRTITNKQSFNAAAAFEDWFKTVRNGRHVSIIPQSEEFAKAGMYGKSVVEYAPRSNAALLTRKTMNEIRLQIGLPQE